jgi:hypothetical protein
MAQAENSRRAYRRAGRVWCAWRVKRNLPRLPASGADVAAFLASERRPRSYPRGDQIAASGLQTLPARCAVRIAATRAEHLERTWRGLRLTLPQTKGLQHRSGHRAPAPRPDRAVPGAGCCGLAGACRHQCRPGFSRIRLPKKRASALPGPPLAPWRPSRGPWRRSSRHGRLRLSSSRDRSERRTLDCGRQIALERNVRA